MSDDLVLGPVLRHVDDTSATVWVEAAHRGVVTVLADGRSWSAPTFSAHGHHYAVVDVVDLAPGTAHDYAVEIDGRRVWPQPDALAPSRIRTLDPERPLRFVFGSCRTSIGHDAEGNASHGVDVLRAYALRMVGFGDDLDAWPDLVLFLGDQVYADETSDAMQEFIAARRPLDEPPGEELKDYEEYAHLYRLAWSDPANRWLLSTLPSAMIFDDHDIRDDWNTSLPWRRRIEATRWWHDRIVGGLASYWVYQHLGNLTPAERAGDDLWQEVLALRAAGQDDITEVLDRFAARADARPETYRWSYVRDFTGARLVVVDSRAARVLEPGRRRMLDDVEASWLAEQLTGDVDHLFIGTSLPFLLPPGLHEVEAWNEATADGAWGHLVSRGAERVRQGVDLEHWAAFQDSFREVADLVTRIADGGRGPSPATVMFLSGDVHHSYLAEVARPPGTTRILQAVCSPIRNPLPMLIRTGQALTSSRPVMALGRALARRAGVPPPPFSWDVTEGPWFDNMLATVELSGRGLAMRWEAADEAEEPEADPVLRTVHAFTVAAPQTSAVPAG
jgi:hypothetical protein